MSDPFLDVKSSVESNKPRWLYEIRQSLLVVYRINGGDRDIVWNGYTWTAEPVASSEVGVSSNSQDYEVSLTLPIKHGFCQRYLAMASPPQRPTVTIYEYQPDIDLAEQVWIGEVTGMESNLKEHVAQFRVPSTLSRNLERVVSSITAGPECPHILYGVDCRASDASPRTITTTVTMVEGRRVVVASVAPWIGDLGRFLGGDLRHVATGEYQTIFGQLGDGTTVDLQAPIPEMQIGDAVVLRIGCAHDLADCHDTFDNTQNYGGFPSLPTSDLFIPGNKVGIYGS